MERNNFVWCFIGTGGTGKTVTAIKLAKDWKYSRRRIGGKVVAFDPHGDFKHVLDVKIDSKDEDWAKILMQRNKDGTFMFANSLLILDDYRSILQGNHMDTDFYDLLALRRKIGMDIIYITHNPKLILQGLAYFNTCFSIFKTVAHSDDFEGKIPHFLPCQRACNLINAYARTFDEQGYNALYPNFPYVMVKENSDKLYPINMKQEIIDKLELA